MEESPRLSSREWQVAELVLQGQSNKQIAAALHISQRTVEFHLKNIYDKAGVSSRVELVLKLREPADRRATPEQGFSTVDREGERIENAGGSDSQRNWITSLKETLTMVSKESGLDGMANGPARDEAGNMSFQESIRICLAKYAEFNGRASRAEFWWFTLAVTLVTTALSYLGEIPASMFLIAVLLPQLAVGARRLRDAGKSPWWLWFLLVPVGGIVTLAILWAMPTAATPEVDELAPR